MSKQLIESIIDDNLVEAKDIFNARMDQILECKLYEEKRRVSAEMNEAFNRPSPDEQRAAGAVKASDVIPDPRGPKKPTTGKGDDVGALMAKLGTEWKKAKFGERRQAVRMVQQAAKQFHGAAAEKAPKTTVTGTETPTQPPRQMPKLVKPEVPRDISVLTPKGKGPKALRKPGAPRNMDIISRYRSGLERSKELQSRGSEGAVKRFKKAYGTAAIPAQAASGLSIIKKGFEAIGQTGG